jgi:hypothetical protein
MVSAEGACAAYYAYGRHLQQKSRPSDLADSPDKPKSAYANV